MTKKKPATSEAALKGGQVAAYRTLKPIAKEINYRLDKAAKSEEDVWDHRLTVVLRLKEAEEECIKGKVKFKDWAEENIQQAPETVRKMLAIGKSENPEQALKEAREKNALANKALRARKKIAEASRDAKPAPAVAKVEDTPAIRILKGFDAMDEGEAVNLFESKALDFGLAVVTVAEAKAAREKPERKAADPFKQFKNLFDSVGRNTQIKMAEYAAMQVGSRRESAERDLGDAEEAASGEGIPEFLQRGG